MRTGRASSGPTWESSGIREYYPTGPRKVPSHEVGTRIRSGVAVPASIDPIVALGSAAANQAGTPTMLSVHDDASQGRP